MKQIMFGLSLGTIFMVGWIAIFAQTRAPVDTLPANPGQTNRAPKIEWIGHPMVSNNDPHWPSQSWLPGYQIGFREDGVVVWRKVKSAQ